MPTPKPKMSLAEIALDFGMTTRQGRHERADVPYLRFSLEPFQNTLKTRYKTDLSTTNGKKILPYTVIVFIYRKLQA